MKSPILFIVFNRPSTTKIVFETIRKAKPARLYIASDGPRKNNLNDDKLCNKVKNIVSYIDWDCDVKTLYREQNLGCKRAVTSAITWFFENEEEGIILEDDVLPLPCFFDYCDELLEKYRYEERVAMISGNNLISKRFDVNESYFFSHYTNIWGWATWRRVWEQHDYDIKKWSLWKKKGVLRRFSDGVPSFEFYWKDQIQSVYEGKLDDWTVTLMLILWQAKSYCIIPSNNLVENIGFGIEATNTTGEMPECVSESIPQELLFPLIHPKEIIRQENADILMSKRVFNIGFFTTLKWKVRRIPFIGSTLAMLRKKLNMLKFNL